MSIQVFPHDASADYRTQCDSLPSYEILVEESSSYLFKKAKSALDVDNDREALIMFSVVAGRYEEEGMPREEASLSLASMINLGFLYGFRLFDYEEALGYLENALDAAERYDMPSDVPLIKLNKACLVLLYHETLGGSIPYSEIIGLFGRYMTMP